MFSFLHVGRVALSIVLTVIAIALVDIVPASDAMAQGARAGDPLAYLEGLTYVRLTTSDIPSMHRARKAIEAHGGTVAIMSPPSTMIGWIPAEIAAEVRALPEVAEVRYEEGARDSHIAEDDAPGRAMANFFDAVVRGEYAAGERRAMAMAAAAGAPDAREPDALLPDTPVEADVLENLRAMGLSKSSLEERGISMSAPGTQSFGNSDAMTGVVALSIFFIESDGTGADPNLYTWTPQDMQSYLNGVAGALAWWASRAPFYGACNVTFLIYYYSGADPRCQQWSEPILHDTSYENVWVNEIMNNFGYTSGDRWSKVTAFNTWQRSTYLTDRAYSAFIPYNPPPAQQSFIGGGTAYAYLPGPYTVLLFRVSGWTTTQVFAHESGHIFGACDEYSGGCSSCGVCYFHGINNGNCETCNPGSQNCMMKANSFALCSFTPGQIGWDGVLSPCTPPPPAPLPAPTVATVSPDTVLQGVSTTLTISGTNFFAGAKVNLGASIFPDIVTFVNSSTIQVVVSVDNAAPAQFYTATITNRDFQAASLPSAVEVKPTRRHYFSPTGSNMFPYVTPATAATLLQSAIDAGASGDTVFVPTMTLANASLLIDSGVLLHGGWNSSFTTRDLAGGKTVLQMNATSVQIFNSPPGGGIDGFIVENGLGTPGGTPAVGYYGGGVHAFDSPSVVVANCEIRNCSAAPGGSTGYGGGISAEGSSIDIRDNWIHGNTATVGGGVFLYDCQGSVSNNIVESNTIVLPSTAVGGGVCVDQCMTLTLTGNIVRLHSGAQNGGGVLIKQSTGVTLSGGSVYGNSAASRGGGVSIKGSTADVRDVLVESNTSALLGGGMDIDETSTSTVSRCRIVSNTALVGGGMFANTGTVHIGHNLFLMNHATSSAGGISLSTTLSGTVEGNTLDRNTAASGAGGIFAAGSGVEVFDNIVTHTTGVGIQCGAPAPPLSYNLVRNSSGGDYSGCTAGPGSGSWDPAYADTTARDYHLATHSGAIDAGRPGYDDADGSRGDLGWYGDATVPMSQPARVQNLSAQVLSGDIVLTWNKSPELDVFQYAVYCDSVAGFKPGASSFVTFVAAPDTSVNLGAVADTTYYVVNAIDNDGYAGGYSNEAGAWSTATTVTDDPAAFADRLYANAPNPFNPVTTIRWELSQDDRVRIEIFDVAGRLVRRLVDENQAGGGHSTVWDGLDDRNARVSSGVYFYRLQTARFAETRKMVMLK